MKWIKQMWEQNPQSCFWSSSEGIIFLSFSLLKCFGLSTHVQQGNIKGKVSVFLIHDLFVAARHNDWVKWVKSYFSCMQRTDSLSPCLPRSLSLSNTLTMDLLSESKLWRLISLKTRTHKKKQAHECDTSGQNEYPRAEKHPRQGPFLLREHAAQQLLTRSSSWLLRLWRQGWNTVADVSPPLIDHIPHPQVFTVTLTLQNVVSHLCTLTSLRPHSSGWVIT